MVNKLELAQTCSVNREMSWVDVGPGISDFPHRIYYDRPAFFGQTIRNINGATIRNINGATIIEVLW